MHEHRSPGPVPRVLNISSRSSWLCPACQGWGRSRPGLLKFKPSDVGLDRPLLWEADPCLAGC